MSKKEPIPSYIVYRMKRFYALHEPMTEPEQILDKFLTHLKDNEGVIVDPSVKSSILQEVIEAKSKQPIPDNNVGIFHRCVGTISASLHRRNIW